SRAAADEAYEVFYAARNEVELYEDARPALDRLATRFRLVALTNGNADVEQIGLGHYFDIVITASAVGASKPDRVMFERAATACGVAPREVVHVGDHPLADVEGALGAGMGAVWLNRCGSPWPEELSPVLRAEGDAHHEIRTLAELEALLAAG
ncbi:MAG: HAD family hydrolase, partial [Pseudomonadota bacterium]